ncbi:MAG: hypothetical protein ACREPN_12690 [Rudaea sp.]
MIGNEQRKLRRDDRGSNTRIVVAFALLAAMMALTGCQWLQRGEPAKPASSISSGNTPPKRVPPALATPQIPIVKQENLGAETALAKAKLSRLRGRSIAADDQGYFLDVLQGRLLEALGNPGGLHRQKAAILLEISNQEVTDNSQPLDGRTRDILGRLTKILIEYRATLVVISVHAGNPAIESANRLASQRIAAAVAHELVESGLPSLRIVASVPNGDDKSTQAVDSNSSARIEVRIEPLLRSDR